MSPVSMLVVFILIWWVVLFMVLPTGVRGQAEEGNVVKGTEPGAPVESQMKRKVITTTVITAVLWVIVCAVIITGVIDLNKFSRFAVS